MTSAPDEGNHGVTTPIALSRHRLSESISEGYEITIRVTTLTIWLSRHVEETSKDRAAANGLDVSEHVRRAAMAHGVSTPVVQVVAAERAGSTSCDSTASSDCSGDCVLGMPPERTG